VTSTSQPVAPGRLAREWHGPQSPVPLVLLHAFPLDRRMWDPVLELLPGLGVLLVDLPGLGESPLPEGEPSLDRSVDALVATLDELGHRRVVLAGVSMGGYVALAFARRHPDRLAGVGLLDTKAAADPPEAVVNRLRMADAVTGETGTRALLPMLDTLLGRTTHERRPELLAAVRERLLQAPPAGVAWSQRAMAARADSQDVLGTIRVPATVLVGEEDTITGPDFATVLVAGLPDVVRVDVPRAGHLAALERPEAVANTLITLMLRVRPGLAG